MSTIEAAQYAFRVSDGSQVTPGTLLQSSKGDTWTFEGVSRPAVGNSSGRVAVSAACEGCTHFYHPDGIEQREFFPSVFDLYLGRADGTEA